MKIVTDDFGTDYSSLVDLKDLPVTTLKTDKGFIEDLPGNNGYYTLVKNIINLGRSLDFVAARCRNV